MSETWTSRTFEIAMGTWDSRRQTYSHHESVEGETWGPFGINAERGNWIVTHLPTGYRLIVAENKRAARRFCLEVADLTDWSAVTPGGSIPTEYRDALLEAWHRARGAVFVSVDAQRGGRDA